MPPTTDRNRGLAYAAGFQALVSAASLATTGPEGMQPDGVAKLSAVAVLLLLVLAVHRVGAALERRNRISLKRLRLMQARSSRYRISSPGDAE